MRAVKCKDCDPSLEYFTSISTTDVENNNHDNKGQFHKILVNLEQNHVLSSTFKLSTILSICSQGYNLPPRKATEFSGRYSEWVTF